MFSIKTSALHFILLALLTVQYGAVLHAVEHPFHAHDTKHEHSDADTHHHQHAYPDHVKINTHTDAETGINCDVFFAGERLAHAVLLASSTTTLKVALPKYAMVQAPSVHHCHALRPRSRSPPTFLE